MGVSTRNKEPNKANQQYDSPGMGSGFGGFNGFNGFNFNFRQMASDLKMAITISLEDAYYGCKYPVNINGKVYSIDIPKGITNGKMLKIEGLGQSGYKIYGQQATGDLIVKINVQSTDKLYLNNNGLLEMVCGVDWIDAILGSEMTVKVFDRDVKVRIPRYTQNGGYTLVGNQGFHKYNSDECGTLKVNFIIRMPKSLTDEQINNLKKVKESLK